MRDVYSSFELLYETMLRMYLGDRVSLLDVSISLHLHAKVAAAQTTPAERVELQDVLEGYKNYSYGDQVRNQV